MICIFKDHFICSGKKCGSTALTIKSHILCRVRFTISTFCMIWKDTIFSVISILNFFKSIGSQTFMKTKIILKSNTIVFDPFNLFVFVNICLLVFFKKFNMDIWVKTVSFQIIQNVLNVKTTLIESWTLFRIRFLGPGLNLIRTLFNFRNFKVILQWCKGEFRLF